MSFPKAKKSGGHMMRKNILVEEFLEAVQNNPVLEGWGDKIVVISDGE